MDYKRVLVFGAHPDDELAMAPAMALLANRGVHVAVCIATDGSEGYPRPEWKDTIVQMRAQEMADADKVVGIAQRICLGVEDMGLVNDKATFKRFIKVIRDVRPDVVFTHGPHDLHRDHLATHALSVEATWQAGQPVSTERAWVADPLPDLLQGRGGSRTRHQAGRNRICAHPLAGSGDSGLAVHALG